MTDDDPVPGEHEPAAVQDAAPERDPVRRWTIILLVVTLLLVAYYLVADRWTPYTSQARVHALVVPIAEAALVS
jgi:multidrug resistance efflux pump